MQKVFTDAVPAAKCHRTGPHRHHLSRQPRPRHQNRSAARRATTRTRPLSSASAPTIRSAGSSSWPIRVPVDRSAFATAYGTTYNYNTDGTPSCVVRGRGVQPASAGVDETNEVYPTCFSRQLRQQSGNPRPERRRLAAVEQHPVQQLQQDHSQRHGPGAGEQHAASCLRQETVSSRMSCSATICSGIMTSMTRYQGPRQQGHPGDDKPGTLIRLAG